MATFINRLHAAAFRISRRLDVPGFDARAFFPDRDQVPIIKERLTEALRLIEAHAPVRYRYLRRDFPRILVGATLNAGESHAPVGICLLGFDTVVSDRTTAAGLAMTLVHEGTHGRLARAGIEYVENARHRIERLCVLAELILAQRLPDASHLVSWAAERLGRSGDFWTDEAFRARALAGLRRMGWYGRPLAAITSLLHRLRFGRASRAAWQRLRAGGRPRRAEN